MHSPEGAGPVTASPSVRKQQEDRTTPAEGQPGTGIHLAEHTRRKTQQQNKISTFCLRGPFLGVETSCDSCHMRARIRFSHSPPTRRSCPFCPQRRGAGHGWHGSWVMSQMHLGKAASVGNLPPAPSEEMVQNQKLCQVKHPTGTDGNATKSKVSNEHLFVT